MKFGKWYVVEVSHFKGNPKHRAICWCRSEEELLVEFVSYEFKQQKNIADLPHFEIIKEIKEMN